METLDEAREFVINNRDAGVDCPCCGQLVKMYRFRFNADMALVLFEMYKRRGQKVHPINDLNTTNGNYAKMRFWGLIEQCDEQHGPDKKSAGYWEITAKGIDFVANRSIVRSRVLIYNNQPFGFEGENLTFEQVLDKKFNYAELMQGVEIIDEPEVDETGQIKLL